MQVPGTPASDTNKTGDCLFVDRKEGGRWGREGENHPMMSEGCHWQTSS